jgi:outer membrane protein TolC
MEKKIQRIIVLAVLICLAVNFSFLYGEDFEQLSLDEAVKIALEYNIMTKNARLDIDAARKKIWETTAIGLPQISLSATYLNHLQLATTLLPANIFDADAKPGEFIEMQFGTQHNASLDFTVNQLIFQGAYIVGLQAARTYLRISEERLEKSEIEIRGAITELYNLVLLAERTLLIFNKSLENLKRILYETSEMHRAGFVEDTDVDQFQLTVTELENAVKSMERQVYLAYNHLKVQLGLDLFVEIKLSDSLESLLKRNNARQLLEQELDLNQHIDFKMADTQVKSFSLLLKKEKSDFLPAIAAFFTHQQNAMRNEFNFFQSSGEKWFSNSILGISIKIPVFSSGMRLARVSQAKYELQKAQNMKNDVRNKLAVDYIKSRSEFENALEKMNNIEKNVHLAEKIYQKNLEKYANGMTTSLDVTQTHNQYLQTQLSYLTVIVEVLKARVNLEKSLSNYK